MPEIRPYRAGDRDAVARICLLTAAGGGDATGVYSDDTLMPEVFALPYVEYAPELAFVVADGDRVLGYVLGVADTAAFIEWWKREWTPGFAARHPSVGSPTAHDPAFTEAELIDAGLDPERMRIAELADYPAHLHIDLLPELQGMGFGRRLIDTLRRRARRARGRRRAPRHGRGEHRRAGVLRPARLPRAAVEHARRAAARHRDELSGCPDRGVCGG